MSVIEGKAIDAALRPVGNIVDALLGPTIDKIRQWSKDKEISDLLKNDNLDLLLERYIERIIRRASELSTLVFPQRTINLYDVYENLELIPWRSPYCSPNKTSSTTEKIDIQSEGSCYVVVDDAGMGKSTLLKNLSLDVIALTDKIPIFFELATYNQSISLIENLATSFDELDRSFNRDLFNKLIVTGRLVIILDGYDELSTGQQDIIKPQLVELSIKKQKSILILSSRPQEKFPNLVQSVFFKINKLTKSQAKSIAHKYDLISGENIGERLSLQFDRIPDKFLETPLLIGLLYRTFGFNNCIADNISVFYSEIFDALYKGHDLTKNGYVREKSCNLDIDGFRALLRVFCFNYIVNSRNITHTLESFIDIAEKSQNSCQKKPVSPRMFCEDLLSAVPLLTRDGLAIKFMHRTIAEYFAAEYIVHSSNSTRLIKKILESPYAESFIDVLEFVYEISPLAYNNAITLPIAERFINQKIHPSTCETYVSCTYFLDVQFSCWKYDDVIVVGEDGTNKVSLKEVPPLNYSSMHYLYGAIQEVRYVLAIACLLKIKVPRSAWKELVNNVKITSSDLSISHKEFSADDFQKLFLFNHWHDFNSPLVTSNCNSEIIRKILHRIIPQCGWFNGKDWLEDNIIQIVTLQSCNKFVNSNLDISRAITDIENLLV